MSGAFWTKAETDKLKADWSSSSMSVWKFSGLWAKANGRTFTAVRSTLQRLTAAGDILPRTLKDSPYPSYSEPLEMNGDALVLTDVEFPFHHAEFVNQCVSLASVWGIKQLILGGDLLHMDSISGWEPSWTGTDDSGVAEAISDQLFEFAKSLPSKRQAQLIDILSTAKEREPEKNISAELNVCRREIRNLQKKFDKIDMVLGNHEGRLLRALETAVDPQELLNLMKVDDAKWRVSPYYYSVLWSAGQKFQIEHPRNTAKFSAWKLAAKYGCHVIMGHSHQLNLTFDISGKFYAIESGHCVDESKLPYASQRHNQGHQHCLGAVLVRDGHPHLLHQGTDWPRMAKMA